MANLTQNMNLGTPADQSDVISYLRKNVSIMFIWHKFIYEKLGQITTGDFIRKNPVSIYFI